MSHNFVLELSALNTCTEFLVGHANKDFREVMEVGVAALVLSLGSSSLLSRLCVTHKQNSSGAL